MTVDFHVHSTASDGTLTPTELVRAADGFAALAITDHDNGDGVGEFLAAGGPGPARRIAGVELSVDPGPGFDRFHLLGLGIDAPHPALTAFLARVLDGRNARNERIIANFARLGIDLGATVGAYAHGDVLARPHFARWLVDHGLAADVKDAFARYLLDDSPTATRCYERRYRPAPEEAFAVIHAAGGLAVMAHPKYGRRDWQNTGCDYEAVRRQLAELKEKGLDGVEAIYGANAPEENVAFTRIALELGLLTSAGSDFHGANKPTIRLGMTVDDAFIRPLLERL